MVNECQVQGWGTGVPGRPLSPAAHLLYKVLGLFFFFNHFYSHLI